MHMLDADCLLPALFGIIVVARSEDEREIRQAERALKGIRRLTGLHFSPRS
jgi:hypothetical protein